MASSASLFVLFAVLALVSSLSVTSETPKCDCDAIVTDLRAQGQNVVNLMIATFDQVDVCDEKSFEESQTYLTEKFLEFPKLEKCTATPSPLKDLHTDCKEANEAVANINNALAKLYVDLEVSCQCGCDKVNTLF